MLDLFRWPSDLAIADIGQTTVKRSMKETELSKAPHTAARQYRAREVLRMYENGVSRRDMAHKLGVSQATVSEYLRSSGITAEMERTTRYRLINLYLESHTWEETCEHFECSAIVLRNARQWRGEK